MRVFAAPPTSGSAAGHGGRRRRAALVALGVTLVAWLPLSGCGTDGDAAAAPEREYTLRLRAEDSGDRYTYVAEDPLDLRAGDRVTFEMRNDGALIHDLVVVHPDGSALATGPAVDAGGVLSLTVDFLEPGFYRLRCNVDDHLTAHDMQVVVEVKQADGSSAG
jgi:uncharacterized cupredoxin-like copper-binding protein